MSSALSKRGALSTERTCKLKAPTASFCLLRRCILDRQYSVWGEVVSGMEHVDAVKKGGEHNNGAISGEPDKILKARIAADKA